MPTTALATPLAETEPNNDALHANGPFGVDGWTQTINVSDDIDYVLFRLQGRRQVALTTSGLTPGCGAFRLSSADGAFYRAVSIFSTPSTATWTTPRDATEYVGNVTGNMGCSSLIKVTPADALITGPLPTPSYPRTLAVAAPGQVGQGASVPVTASGVAADDDQVQAQWRTGGCPAAPDTSSGGSIVRGSNLAAGAYSVVLDTTSPEDAGAATLCVWLYDTLGKLDALVRQQTVAVVAPPVDRDADGIPAGVDCDDGDPAIKPGARDIPGNAIDENCDGVLAPFPRVPATVTLTSTSLPKGKTRIRSLVVRRANRAFSVRVRCTGRGCRTYVDGIYRAGHGSSTLSLTNLVHGLRLGTGATLSVKIYASGYQSRVFTYTMRRGRAPRPQVRCSNPGVTATFAC